VAPGNRIVAAIPTSSELVAELPTRLVACSTLPCSDHYLSLSGTSMATPLVAATAALMLGKDPSLSPATDKARLMQSARKIAVNATEAGAGVLDVDAALDATGIVDGEALSPLLKVNATGQIQIENTATLWGSSVWATGYVWADGYLWADG
jgi:subtilisin family serine protease